MSIRSIGGLVVLALCAVASAAGAQRATPCSFSADHFSTDSTAAGQIVFAAGNVVLRCPARGIVLRGDSAERYPDHEYMIGHVIYDEPRFHVTSNYLNYFPQTEIVKAVGDVHARLPSGSTLVGPIAEYRRIQLPARPRAQMLAIARPTISIVEKDSTGKKTDPTVVVANQVYMDGDSLIYGGGQVVITRPEMSATADSAFIDDGHETMRLMRNPQLKGKKEKPFTLNGELIDLFSKSHKLQRVISRANAVAVSDSMTLRSDTIDLRLKDDALDHAYAWGKKSRARVITTSQNVLADSLDVIMPGQKVQLVRAVRDAFAQGKPDTTRFRVTPPDTTNWLRGDTIVAHFDSLPPTDTSKTPPIKQLVANGHASSLYHIAPSDSTEKRAAINYTNARTIIVDFDQQRVATITAVDSVHGMFIEPKTDSTAAKRTKATNAPPKSTQPPVPAKTPAKPPAAAVVPPPPKRP